jgi:signal transduction histidine kinase
MEVLRRAARRLTGADGVTVVLKDGDLCYYADEDAIAPLWKGQRFPLSVCISGWCMINRQQVAISDIYADARVPHDAYRPTFVRSLAMTPIRREEPIGAIGAYWADNHTASDAELEVLRALGDAASVAFANVQLIAKLEESNQRKDEFLAMLAHELRNPLAPIRNGLQVLRLAGDLNTGAERARSMMERQVTNLTRIVDGLMDVARLTCDRLALQRERLDLAWLIRQALEDHLDHFRGARLDVQVRLPDRPVWVDGDATRLTQILDSLLDNAVKFAPDGHLSIDLVIQESSTEVVCTFRDDGVGIEKSLLPRVFDTFAQGDRSLERSGGGLGLGLAIARGLLELHQGSIEAASPGVGQGSTFVIRLPWLGEPPMFLKTIEPPVNASTARILIVEDNRDSAESLRMLLELTGYQVTVAHSGPQGLQAAEAIKPEIVLCDIGLPGMTGYELAITLRRNGDMAGARMIALTGYGREEDRLQALAAGFDDHMVKPVDPYLLLKQLACWNPELP